MTYKPNYSLNRIILPHLNLDMFFKFVSGLGLNKVELRNDLSGMGIIDDYSPEQVIELSNTYDIKILAINALQQFNLGALLNDKIRELNALVELSRSIGCEALVLVPNNDLDDTRSENAVFNETVSAMKAYSPLLEDCGIVGLVEPLGFEECSLRSKVTAMRAIQESGSSSFKIVHDTFHHYLGPDTDDAMSSDYDTAFTGLVHVSGVESDIPMNRYKDDHRILITPNDKLENRRQIEWLTEQGYQGAISFEPFAEDIQGMEPDALKMAVQESIALLLPE